MSLVKVRSVVPATRDIVRGLHDSESLDDLADMASKLFSPVANRGVEALPMIHEHPFGPNEAGVRKQLP